MLRKEKLAAPSQISAPPLDEHPRLISSEVGGACQDPDQRRFYVDRGRMSPLTQNAQYRTVFIIPIHSRVFDIPLLVYLSLWPL